MDIAAVYSSKAVLCSIALLSTTVVFDANSKITALGTTAALHVPRRLYSSEHIRTVRLQCFSSSSGLCQCALAWCSIEPKVSHKSRDMPSPWLTLRNAETGMVIAGSGKEAERQPASSDASAQMQKGETVVSRLSVPALTPQELVLEAGSSSCYSPKPSTSLTEVRVPACV